MSQLHVGRPIARSPQKDGWSIFSLVGEGRELFAEGTPFVLNFHREIAEAIEYVVA